MSIIRGAAGIRDAYRNETVASQYIDERFREPLGALLHARQVDAVRRVLKKYRAERVLELAPGPARVTSALDREFGGVGVVVDTSAQMLAEARRRLTAATRFRLVQGDAFVLPFVSTFDCVYTFRLIRHFDLQARLALYQQVARCLKPGGLFVFDAVNVVESAPLRATAPGEYQHFDALLTEQEVRSELDASGFDVLELQGVQHRPQLLGKTQVYVSPRSRLLARAIMEVIDRLPGGAPLEWIVLGRRR